MSLFIASWLGVLAVPTAAGEIVAECCSKGPGGQDFYIKVARTTGPGAGLVMEVEMPPERRKSTSDVVEKDLRWSTLPKTRVDKALAKLAVRSDAEPERVVIHGWRLEGTDRYYQASIYEFYDEGGGPLGKSASFGYWLNACLPCRNESP